MNLILVLPDHTDAVAGAGAAALPPTLARLAAYARPIEHGQGIVQALLGAMGAPATAVAPLLAAGSGLAVRGGTQWLAATPVMLGIQGNDVRVVARTRDLPQSYAIAAITRFNATFAEDDIHFEANRADAWFASMPVGPAMTNTPVDCALGQSLYAHRPTGTDARRWERFGNEIQMLLFALNNQDGTGRPAPSEDGEPRPNGVWFWGGGAWTEGGAARLGHVRAMADRADTTDAADLARGVMLLTQRVPEALPAALAEVLAGPAGTIPTTMLIVLPAHAQDLLGTHWLHPAMSALEQHRITRLTVVAGNAPTLTWSATPPSLLARIRARLTSRDGNAARA